LEEGIVVIGEEAEGALGEFDEAGGVEGAGMFSGEGFLFIGLEAGIVDFADLEAEQVELAGVGLVIDDEMGAGGDEGGALVEEVGEGGAPGIEIGEGVEDGELSCGLEEGLVFVGAVEVDELFAEGGEGGEGGGGTVDELAIGAAGGEGAFEDEDGGFAGIDAEVGEEGIDGDVERAEVEDGFDGAEVGPGAEGAAIGALSEDELEGAEDDGFAGAGFAGEDVEAWLEFEGEIGHEGEISDPQRRQHGASGERVEWVGAGGNDGEGGTGRILRGFTRRREERGGGRRSGELRLRADVNASFGEK
jgi:hypothetical protein